MSNHFANPQVKKYSPNDYIWPVFSIRNYIQRADGWFIYRKKDRRRNRKDRPEIIKLYE